MTRLSRLVILVCASATLAGPARADDILFTPFIGKTFAAQATLQTAEPADTRKWIFGGAATWLNGGVLGAEIDFSYAPRFFDAGQSLTVPGSNVITLTGNVLVAAPLSITRESLRPYLVGGIGLLHAGAGDQIDFFPVDRNLTAISIGGGAIGFLNNRTGLRFDLRHLRSASSGDNTATGLRQPKLGFWRATVGVTIRY